MSRLERVEEPVLENLPSETARELQVEQLWARQNVLADRMNVERLNTYACPRALLWPDHLICAARH